MIEQRFHLKRWDWDIIVMYDACRKDSEYILSVMKRVGCGNLRPSMKNLESGRYNTGLTNTCPEAHTTVMVLGRTTSPSEFYNTIDHEKGHAVEHIASALMIPHSGEEIEYLRGELSQKMYPVAVGFLCEGCKRESVGERLPSDHSRR